MVGLLAGGPVAGLIRLQDFTAFEPSSTSPFHSFSPTMTVGPLANLYYTLFFRCIL